ncbi:MAG: ATP-binding protein [Verrucomicrobiota bacterium]
MKRWLESRVERDLARKMVFLTGPRQAGKTTLASAIAARVPGAQMFNWDVLADRRVLLAQSWVPTAPLLVFDELHKMKDWRQWLKGVFDGRAPGQSILVTGSARLDAFRQAGESLAGRYYSWHLLPVTVSELVTSTGATPQEALTRLLQRGGFPEPLLAEDDADAQRWRQLYLEGLIRDDILELSRIAEVRAMRLFVEMLRERVGSPLSLASIARDLQVSPTTLARYLEILETLHVVFVVRPFHHNVARSLLKEPKIYYHDTGLVSGGDGPRFENACATMLHAAVQARRDAEGVDARLQYIRDKDGREIDFAVCEGGAPVRLVECKWADQSVPTYLAAMAVRFPGASTTLLVRHLRQRERRGSVAVESAAEWLAETRGISLR